MTTCGCAEDSGSMVMILTAPYAYVSWSNRLSRSYGVTGVDRQCTYCMQTAERQNRSVRSRPNHRRVNAHLLLTPLAAPNYYR